MGFEEGRLAWKHPGKDDFFQSLQSLATINYGDCDLYMSTFEHHELGPADMTSF